MAGAAGTAGARARPAVAGTTAAGGTAAGSKDWRLCGGSRPVACGGAGAMTGGPHHGWSSQFGRDKLERNARTQYRSQCQVLAGDASHRWLRRQQCLVVPTGVQDRGLRRALQHQQGSRLSILRNRVPFRENPSNDDKFINKNTDGTYKYTANSDGSKTFSLNWSNWDVSNTSTLISDINAAGADYQVTKFMSTPWTPPNNSIKQMEGER